MSRETVMRPRSGTRAGSLRLPAGELFDVARLANRFDFQSDAANYDKITMKVACFEANWSFNNARQWDHTAELGTTRNTAVVESAW